jgi:hypothetical protein
MENTKYGIDADYGQADNALRDYDRLWSNVAEAYKAIGLRPLKTSDLKNIFGGESFIKDIKLEGSESAKIGNINLSKEELHKLIDVRNWEFSRFLEATQALLSFIKENRTIKINVSDYKVVDGEILFEDAESVLKQRYSLHAKTPKQIAVLTALREICSALNECGAQIPGILASEQYILFRNGHYSVNPEGMKRI